MSMSVKELVSYKVRGEGGGGGERRHGQGRREGEMERLRERKPASRGESAGVKGDLKWSLTQARRRDRETTGQQVEKRCLRALEARRGAGGQQRSELFA